MVTQTVSRAMQLPAIPPEPLILSALRLDPTPWPENAGPGYARAVLHAAAAHGVTPLLSVLPTVHTWPEDVRSVITSATRVEIAVEAIRRHELTRLLADLANAGVRGLLLKGTHLAYSHYPQPWLRPRVDTDLLVPIADRAKADRVLRNVGYQPVTDFGGQLVTHQFQYQRTNPLGLTAIVDLHWKVANPHVFSDMFSFDELHAASVGIDLLGPHARGLSDEHALMIACVHRTAHHGNADCLIWLYDIHLLASALSEDARRRVASLADRKRVTAVCARGIADAKARFTTEIPANWLETASPHCQREPSAAFLRAGRTKAHVLISDLCALQGWQQRARLVWEHVVPPSDYMRRLYGISNPFLLPAAYVNRLFTGIGKWFSA
jgi:hypothetical protein